MQHSKRPLKKPKIYRLPTRKPKSYSLLVFIVVFAAAGAGVYSLLTGSNSSVQESLAAPAEVPVIAPTVPGAPIPSSGFYFGSTAFGATTTVSGCPQPLNTTKAQEELLECVTAKMGKELGLPNAPADPTKFTYNLLHEYTGCSDTVEQRVKDAAADPYTKALLITMSCGRWDTLWDDSKNANQVASIKKYMDAINALNVPTIFVFRHEPEPLTCSGASSLGSAADYRAASRKFTDVVRKHAKATNFNDVSVGWTLMGYTFVQAEKAYANGTLTAHDLGCGTPQPRNPFMWYPGDDAIDWLLPDNYARTNERADLKDISDLIVEWFDHCDTYPKPRTNFNCNSNTLKQKPWGFGEYGIANIETDTRFNKAARIAFWNDHLTLITQPKYSKLKMLAYWGSNRFAANGEPCNSGPDDGYCEERDFRIHYPENASGLDVVKAHAKVVFDDRVFNVGFGGTTPPPSDTTAPTGSFVAPKWGDTVSGNVQVDFAASDDVAVDRVEFSYDTAQAISIDGASPYVASWNTQSLSNGEHILRAKIFDSSGNMTSKQITVTVNNPTSDTTNPTGSFVSPKWQSTVTDTVSIEVNAADNVAVDKVEFRIDGIGTIDTADSAPYKTSFDTQLVPNGELVIRAFIYDSSGNSYVPLTRVQVSNSTQISADLNTDGKVDVYDLTTLLGKWNTTDTTADISKDGIVNVFDLSILLSKWTG